MWIKYVDIPLTRDDGGQRRLSRSSCHRVDSVPQCPQLFGNVYLDTLSNAVVSATSIDDLFIANQHHGKHREAAHLQINDVVGFSARNLFASSTLTQGRPSGQLFSDSPTSIRSSAARHGQLEIANAHGAIRAHGLMLFPF